MVADRVDRSAFSFGISKISIISRFNVSKEGIFSSLFWPRGYFLPFPTMNLCLTLMGVKGIILLFLNIGLGIIRNPRKDK